MKMFCWVCKKETYHYNAFGKDDKAVCCSVCKAPQERIKNARCVSIRSVHKEVRE
jgi:Zn finger protein HypA/HybF involved in hydrogenase expression